MEDHLICKQCGKQLSATPYALKIHYQQCRETTIFKGSNTDSSQEHGRIFADVAKRLKNQFRKNNGSSPRSISKGEWLRCDSISMWEVPHGKRAVLCGVSYNMQKKFKLKGTIHDVKCMKELLVNRFHFQTSSIKILIEDEEHHHPTKKNIQAALQWLVKDCQQGDSLVFYFSGHGLRQPDFCNDERDGFDETICPVDFKTEGMIIDNEINSTIVRPLKLGVKLHAIIDACHSGTILDLPCIYSTKEKKWVDNRPPSGVNKGTSGGLAICFSACEDDQLAGDTTAFSREMAGAMTYTFKKAIENNSKITYGGLVSSMHKAIKEATETGCFKLKGIFHPKPLQEPLLSSSQEFDINSELKL